MTRADTCPPGLYNTDTLLLESLHLCTIQQRLLFQIIAFIFPSFKMLPSDKLTRVPIFPS